MGKSAWIAVFVLIVVAGSVSAQNQVRLDPNVDGGLYVYSEGTTGVPFIGGPQTLDIAGYSYFSSSETAYVMKFDLSGIGEVLDARLIVYFPSTYGYQSSLFWQNGGNESSSPSTVNLNDFPSGMRHYPDSVFGPGGGPNSGFYGGASWDITDEVRSDLPGGHSDYVIRIAGGYFGAYQPIFTTHLRQQPNGGDAQGSPFGPYVLYTPSAIPEPGTLALLGLGLVSLGVAYRRRRRKAA